MTHRRGAFLAVVALGIIAFVGLLAIMLSRSAIGMLAHEQLRCAEAQIDQWLISARDRVKSMRESPPVELPIDGTYFESATLRVLELNVEGHMTTHVTVSASYRGRMLQRSFEFEPVELRDPR
ncbi:MAG: hypothetical protein ACKVS9_14525 [Phycisphaerae bacterium]